MRKRGFFIFTTILMTISLFVAACTPSAPAAPANPTPSPATTSPSTPPPAATTPASPPVSQPAPSSPVSSTPANPKYGGTLTLASALDITSFEPITSLAGAPTRDLTNQELWAGDWTKGHAGGYGTDESSWNARLNNFDQKTGLLSVGNKPAWTIDEAANVGTIVYQIRQGVHYGLNPNSEASKLVGGREMTADDVVFNLKRNISDPKSSVYLGKTDIRTANITKTGPWEVTIKAPATAMMTALTYIGGTCSSAIVPPEVVAKYGDMTNWKNSVGTGPFILTDYVPGSIATMVKNTNYWMKDPIGPGKGNQLPYLDKVQVLILPDSSTRLAALRTGKLDQFSLGFDDASQMRKTTPQLLEAPGGEPVGGWGRMHINTARAPFNDVRVRRAMVMAIDFNAINQSLFQGKGQIITYPMSYWKEYAALYVGINDPDLPQSIKDQFTYNPDKAKQLLKDAGYPNGFKASVLTTSTSTDYFSIVKDMWSKVGIDLSFDVRDAAVMTTVVTSRAYDMTNGAQATPDSSFFSDTVFVPGAPFNASQINDPYINDLYAKMTKIAATDLHQAMLDYRAIALYALDQAYGIGSPAIPATTFWWPWLKNYSGETSMGYSDASWPQYIWYDEAFKKSMGH
jgi:peptide/nickel transport system substrate-binding protein